MSLRWFKVSEQTGISGKNKKTCSKPGALITNSHDSSSKSSIWWWSKVHIRFLQGFIHPRWCKISSINTMIHPNIQDVKMTCLWNIMKILLLQLASPNSKSGKSASLAGKRSCLELALHKELCIITLGSIFCEQALLVKNNRRSFVEFAKEIKNLSTGQASYHFS